MSIKKKDKRQRIPLSKYTIGGRISTVLGIVSIIVLVIAIALSIKARGNAGMEVGIMATITFGLSIIGFGTGILSFKEETRFLTYSWVGTIMNLTLCLIMSMMLLIYV